MMNDDFLNYLLATNQIDNFFDNEIPEYIQEGINILAEEYENDKIDEENVSKTLKNIESNNNISYKNLKEDRKKFYNERQAHKGDEV